MFRKRFIRIIALVFVFALVCTVSFARGDADEEEAAAGAPTDIKGTVKFYKGPFGPNEVELQQKIIDEFNKEYPNIEVIFETADRMWLY